MPRRTLDTTKDYTLSPTGLSPSLANHSKLLDWNVISIMWSVTPTLRLVWAPPLSLAATDGIRFSFFSSGY